MKLFLSWSGGLSGEVASALRDWLPYVIQSVRPFLSSGGDISKGERWGDVLTEELKDAQYGIVCVTPGNFNKPWLNFEAGVLSKFIDQSAVSPFLFRVDQSALMGGPLSQFQATVYSKDDVFSLVCSINKRLGRMQVDSEVLRCEFDTWWPNLKKRLDDIDKTLQEETRTYYQWLYTPEDFAEFEGKADYGSVWVITHSVFERAIKEDVRKIVNEKARNGVKYKYFLPASIEVDPDLRKLKEMVGSNQVKTFDLEVFDTQAVTDYVIFDVDDADVGRPLRMFLKYPFNGLGQFWIKVDEESARHFKTRFQTLWDSQPMSVATSASQQ